MCKTRKLSILVVSDLHCQPDGLPIESYFRAGLPRIPRHAHPLQALLDLVENESIQCDIVACPGDMTNKADRIGLAHCWHSLSEIQRKVKAKVIAATLGNHDVDSRGKGGGSAFSFVRSFSPDFPVSEKEQRDRFFADGFCQIVHENFSVLLINSAVDHHDKSLAERGNFPDESLEELERYLAQQKQTEFGLVVVHHHPLLHSGVGMSSEDVLQSGDRLLALLAKHNYRTVIHGHRHMPKMTTVRDAAGVAHVLGAGSFSKLLETMQSQTRNVLHHLVIEVAEDASLRGWVHTYEFNLDAGWRRSSRQSSGLPYHVGFSDRQVDISALAQKISGIVGQNEKRVKEEAILSEDDSLLYLSATEEERLWEILLSKFSVRALHEKDTNTFLGVMREK